MGTPRFLAPTGAVWSTRRKISVMRVEIEDEARQISYTQYDRFRQSMMNNMSPEKRTRFIHHLVQKYGPACADVSLRTTRTGDGSTYKELEDIRDWEKHEKVEDSQLKGGICWVVDLMEVGGLSDDR
ncbi:hypothetical protein BC830DRAFT_1083866 [Chytriomyces sp. MP71]|nr:hypothetical protein BC830DRAFT_1083866 [Chytriomyces sp. MP71]